MDYVYIGAAGAAALALLALVVLAPRRFPVITEAVSTEAALTEADGKQGTSA